MAEPRTDLAVSSDGDWPAHAADTVVRVVDLVRGKTTGPAITVARAVVYGLLAAVLGTAALVLFAIGAVRAIDNYVPGEVWAAHLIVGAVFTIAGWFLWLKRRAKPAAA